MPLRRLLDHRGAALVIALLVTALLAALGMALVLTTTTEVMIGGNYSTVQEARYAADAAAERAFRDLTTSSDWNPVLQGVVRSSFADGTPGGTRDLGDGTRVDLTETVNLANCGHAAACTAAEMDDSTADRPWGANNPRWTPYAYGRISALLPVESVGSSIYVVVMVADDASENDNDPAMDGAGSANPGAGIIGLRAEAFGAGGTHAVIEVTLTRTRILAWHTLR